MSQSESAGNKPQTYRTSVLSLSDLQENPNGPGKPTGFRTRISQRKLLAIIGRFVLARMVVGSLVKFTSGAMGNSPTMIPSNLLQPSPALYETLGQVETVSRNSFILSGVTIQVNSAMPADIVPGAVLSLTAIQQEDVLVLNRYRVIPFEPQPSESDLHDTVVATPEN